MYLVFHCVCSKDIISARRLTIILQLKGMQEMSWREYIQRVCVCVCVCVHVCCVCVRVLCVHACVCVCVRCVCVCGVCGVCVCGVCVCWCCRCVCVCVHACCVCAVCVCAVQVCDHEPLSYIYSRRSTGNFGSWPERAGVKAGNFGSWPERANTKGRVRLLRYVCATVALTSYQGSLG